MKTKDMPSVRATKAAIESVKILRVVGMRDHFVDAEIKRAYMAGYRHGRKMAKETKR